MKRLRKKLANLVHTHFKQKRTKRRLVFAEWVPADINDPNIIQYVTDVMSTGGNVQIEYNGEWKTIAPYGWNSSQAGNVLLMCYKDTGEVRSYRLDRITNVQFDSDTMDTSLFAPQDGEAPDGEELSVDGLEVPTLPEEQQFGNEENQGPKEPESPFADAIQTLEDAADQFKEDNQSETIQPETDLSQEEHPNEMQEQNVIDDPNQIPLEEEQKEPALV